MPGSVASPIVPIASLATGAVTGSSGSDTLVGMENLVGSALADRLEGDAKGNVLAGGLGNDILGGDSGRDRLFGGDGSDTFTGRGGNDTIDGANHDARDFMLNNPIRTGRCFAGMTTGFQCYVKG